MTWFRGYSSFVATLLCRVLLLQPWRALAESFVHSDVAVQLSTANFTSTLSSLEAEQICLVEFYASWCPACKHFAPTFETFARFLKDKRLGGRLLFIARVDCASEADLCGSFDLPGYPSLFLGPAPDFAAKQHKKLHLYNGHDRQVPHLVAWVGEYFKTELKYTPETAALGDSSGSGGVQAPLGAGREGSSSSSSGHVKRRPLPQGPEWSLADVEGATLQLWSIVATTPRLHRGAEKRAALRGLLEGWAAAHPSMSCKSQTAAMLSSYDKLWPPEEEDAPATLLESEPCGPPGRLSYRGEWVTCRGSKPDSRGYSCGLWQMLHTMALRLPDLPGAVGPAQSMMTFLTLFNTHFFLCEPCQKHFGRILSSPEAAAVTDRRALALWLWRVHNEVNERLHGIETRYGHSTTGDPEFPKEQWPAPESCPMCRTEDSGAWVEERVWEYLQGVYGADGGSAAKAVVLGLDTRRRTSSALYGMLPVLGVLAAAILLFLFMRSSLAVSARRGRGGAGSGGILWPSAK
ncbi:hypothetical protein VOLCADRAFT_121037 [Volvox carteri f. nagariensis]|uniref:Sulfhydryl oxidase n=1 Tax=Volvox carteri f. nagariensis TaxID=3068 RepID=D8U000_VOLCA|nr:uncharacterized protein VOLCADRAFT_121037 [Volvox carteri f. nagariensis]EFJ47022.1 hypothetical protein VOLCADRAFT_121037 [Volvox carteri f. nagariensis]|eukprot:XP_002951917.1 hypothetical protein VOLCADRAFT_121037 [Volvox carteri f. nagariensis]